MTQRITLLRLEAELKQLVNMQTFQLVAFLASHNDLSHLICLLPPNDSVHRAHIPITTLPSSLCRSIILIGPERSVSIQSWVARHVTRSGILAHFQTH